MVKSQNRVPPAFLDTSLYRAAKTWLDNKAAKKHNVLADAQTVKSFARHWIIGHLRRQRKGMHRIVFPCNGRSFTKYLSQKKHHKYGPANHNSPMVWPSARSNSCGGRPQTFSWTKTCGWDFFTIFILDSSERKKLDNCPTFWSQQKEILGHWLTGSTFISEIQNHKGRSGGSSFASTLAKWTPIFARWTSQLKQKFKRLATFWIRNSPTLSLVGEAIIKVIQNHLVIHYQGVQLIEVFPGMVRRDRNLLRTKFPLKGVLRVKGVKGPLSKEILFKVSLERIADHFVWSPLWLIHI